ncbi:MAG: hypothetical protein AAGA70_13185 [Pseudomonadota bacterium]
MYSIVKIARRTFLVSSVAIAGGVAFGTYMVRRPLANPLEAGLADGEAKCNPGVRISDKGVTLITPPADIDPGAVHMQSLLIAEELDLEPGQFQSEFGRPAPAYYNRGLGAEFGGVLAALTHLPAADVESRRAVANLRTEAGHVILPDGTPLPFRGFTTKAAEIAPVKNLGLRPRTAWRLAPGRPTDATA